MRLRNMELRARAVVEGLWHGLHRSPFHGFSVEFTEYRQYVIGDDPRFIDWRLLARSDRFYIKKFEDETNLRCHLLVDLSRSMSFGSLEYTKAQYSATLAATFAYFLNQQSDAVGLVTFDDQVREFIPARHRPGHMRSIMLALEKSHSASSTDLVASLERCAALLRKRGMIVILSDFLAPLAELERSLGLLTATGHEVLLLQVLDPAELDFSFSQPLRLKDLENRRELHIDPLTARSGYLRKMNAHMEALNSLCRRLGILYYQIRTSNPLEATLLTFLQEREALGRFVARRVGRH